MLNPVSVYVEIVNNPGFNIRNFSGHTLHKANILNICCNFSYMIKIVTTLKKKGGGGIMIDESLFVEKD